MMLPFLKSYICVCVCVVQSTTRKKSTFAQKQWRSNCIKRTQYCKMSTWGTAVHAPRQRHLLSRGFVTETKHTDLCAPPFVRLYIEIKHICKLLPAPAPFVSCAKLQLQIDSFLKITHFKQQNECTVLPAAQPFIFKGRIDFNFPANSVCLTESWSKMKGNGITHGL